MNGTEIALAISLTMNVLVILGVPIALFVRYIMRLLRWTFVGFGPTGVDVVTGRPKGRLFLWPKTKAPVVLDSSLAKTTPDGRPVQFVDLIKGHAVSPEMASEHPDLAEYAKVYASMPGYSGICVNDKDTSTIVYRGKLFTTPVPVWTRLSGARMHQIYKDIRTKQINDPDTGLWGALERMTPILGIVVVILLIVLMFMVGGVGGA